MAMNSFSTGLHYVNKNSEECSSYRRLSQIQIQAYNPTAFYIKVLSPFLKGLRFHNYNHHETRDHESKCNPRNQCDTPSTSWKFPPYDPMLGLEISVKADEKHHDTDTKERRA